ncbi:16016_t:CDS:2, partial [Acaulospora colombiana]
KRGVDTKIQLRGHWTLRREWVTHGSSVAIDREHGDFIWSQGEVAIFIKNMENFCSICLKQVHDSRALYCSSECANIDMGSSSMQVNSTPPPSPPIHLRFSISITPNVYHASDANSILSPPSSVSSSYADSDISSSFTSTYTLDNDYENCDTCKEDALDDEYYPSIYSTSNPIDIPNQKTQTINDSALAPLNKGTFGED